MSVLKNVMKIVADENMPKVAEMFSAWGEVTLVDGRSLSKAMLTEADVLLVRSVTKVNQELLEGTPVKFVGTATIGVDHIDQAYLASQHIGFASAPGCNANAVADYVVSALCYLYVSKGVPWLEKKIGIIGYGNVGRTVYQRLKAVGCDLVVYDPFQQRDSLSQQMSLPQQAHDAPQFVSLEEVMQRDIVCLHAPLTKVGDFPTFHMLNAQMLAYLKSGASIISAGRGGVIDEQALFERHQALLGQLNLVFDVWEREPVINPQTLSLVDIATPHIAGYSKQGREQGTLMVFEAFRQFCAHVPCEDNQKWLSPGAVTSIVFGSLSDKHRYIANAVNSIYDVMRDDSYLRAAYRKCELGVTPFDGLRKHYIDRDELSTCVVSDQEFNGVLTALGFSSKP